MTPYIFPSRRLKDIADVRFSNVDKKSVDGEPHVVLCNYTDVYYNDRITDSIDFMEATATPTEIKRFRLKAGDILITKDSESPNDIGVPALVETSAEHAVCGYHLAQVRPTCVDSKFLFYVFKSKFVAGYFGAEARGVTRFALSQPVVKETPIPYPARDEQSRIADLLDAELARLDRLYASLALLAGGTDRKEGLLAEYRLALVTAAVAGELDPSLSGFLPDVDHVPVEVSG